MDLFRSNSASNYFSTLKRQLFSEIESLSDSDVTNTDLVDWAEYYQTKFEVQPITFFEDNIKQDLHRAKVKEYNQYYERGFGEDEYYLRDGYCISFSVPFDGNSDLFKIEPYSASMRSFSPSHFLKSLPDDYGYIKFDLTYSDSKISQMQDQKKEIWNDFENEFRLYKDEVQKNNLEAIKYNSVIRSIAKETLEKRKDKASKFEQLSKVLEIPIERKKDAPNTKPILLKRINKKPLLKPSSKPIQAESSISEEVYTNINNIIYMCGTAFEKTARSFRLIYEEELRDFLLATLNTHYENATGEAFRKIGKTDIQIEFENKAAFVGECKIWHGTKALGETIQQVLSYMTWRDVKCSVIIFNKDNRVFSDIIAKTDEWVRENTKSHIKPKQNSWNCIYYKEESQVNIQINITIFDLYVDETQLKDKRLNK